MVGYSGTPLWKKLGYRDRVVAWVKGGPADYLRLLQLPVEISVRWLEQPKQGLSFVHLFATTSASLQKDLRSLREMIDPAGTVWVSWPKKSSRIPSNITEDVVRRIALSLGFVDIKVCAVDDVWSGLKLVIRRELR